MTRTRLLVLTKYGPLGASSRLRSLQYLPPLQAERFDITSAPLLSDAQLVRRYETGNYALVELFWSYALRLRHLLSRKRFDLVWIEKEALPWLPAWCESALLNEVPLVLDYDDAIFHQYDMHPNPWVRRLLGRKIATVMRLANTVVAGNAYLADYARRAGAPRVEVIPTVIDLARYRVKDADSASGVFTIGWIGSPSTARYLHDIAPALAQVCRDGRARVRLVGSGPIELPGVPVDLIDWQEETEVDEIRKFDVGIMPLPDEPWARGKCGFKLIQYMACGLPVVASPIGVNTEIVEEHENGYLARDGVEWVAALERLLSDAALRERLGAAGRRKVQDRYCLNVTVPRLAAVLQSVMPREMA